MPKSSQGTARSKVSDQAGSAPPIASDSHEGRDEVAGAGAACGKPPVDLPWEPLAPDDASGLAAPRAAAGAPGWDFSFRSGPGAPELASDDPTPERSATHGGQ